jgi:hypothetical protein
VLPKDGMFHVTMRGGMNRSLVLQAGSRDCDAVALTGGRGTEAGPDDMSWALGGGDGRARPVFTSAAMDVSS